MSGIDGLPIATPIYKSMVCMDIDGYVLEL